MRQLTFIKPGKLEWWDVPEPSIQSNEDIIVEPLHVSRCDLDYGILTGMAPFKSKLLHAIRNHLPRKAILKTILGRAPFLGPFPFGHEFIGKVIDKSAGVTTVEIGDVVAVPFQISCGTCHNCLLGFTNNCSTVGNRAAYGLGDLGGKKWGGAISDKVRVPFANHLAIKIPKSLNSTHYASLGDNLVDAYRCLEPFTLKGNSNSSLLVVGGLASSIGLYALAIAKELNIQKIVYTDFDTERLRIAKEIGVEVINGNYKEYYGEFFLTIDASGDPKGLLAAINSTMPMGYCISPSIYYKNFVKLPLLKMYGRGITFITGRAQVHLNMNHLISMCCKSQTALKIQGISKTIQWEDAAEGLFENYPKVVVTRVK